MRPIQVLTKVRLPRQRPDVLRRSRLVDFVHQNADKRLILVCAPAGYGKTTMLVDFAHDVDLPVCWYSMDASDADPRTFFECLLLALRQRFPDFGQQTEALLNSIEDVGRDANSLVAALVNEIQSGISDYFFLVLDDYHWVYDSAAVNSALDLLIYYLPDNCHLVISSRMLPHITFSRLAAQRQVAGLGTSDLRFTADELSKLLRRNYKLAMPASQIQQLTEASEGWITGIVLTTHTMWMGLVESLVKAKGARSPLFDYLANEAYLLQPPEIQRFLLCSSVLDQMTPELCDRLFAEGTAGSSLQYLLRANLFISELEGPGDWYRYHALFQEFLRTKLKSEDPHLFARLHCRVAAMAEAEGEWDRAFKHYQTAGDSAGATRLVEQAGDTMAVSGHWKTLHEWLGSLPPGAIDAGARLSLLRGRTFLWLGEADRATVHLDRASRLFQQAGDVEGAGSALVIKSMGLRYKGRLAEAMAASKQALALQEHHGSRVVADAHRDIGICLASLGRMGEAEAELQQALEIHQELRSETGVATLCQAMGLLAVQMGDLGQGMAYYRRAISAWRNKGNVAATAGVLNCIASVHHFTGEYQQALATSEEALATARQSGNLRSQAFALATRGDVERDSGALRQALDSYESGLNIAQQVDEMQLTNYLLDALSTTHRLTGEYATSERLLRQALRQAEENQSPYEVATYSVSFGVLTEELGNLPEAEKLFRSAVDQLEAFGAKRELARCRFHLARTLLALGDEVGARHELEACLEMCRRLGYDQFMVAEGQRARALISWALDKGVGGRALELVAERLGAVAPPVRVAGRSRVRLESPGAKRVEVFSFGAARVLVDSRLITSSDWAVEKTKELLFYLLEQHQGPRKEQILDALWPDLELGKGNSQVHSTIYRLRRALFPQCVAFSDSRYNLRLGKACWYDADEFCELMNSAERPGMPPEEQAERYQRAVSLYRGAFLEEFYSDWVTSRRGELENRYVQALTRLAKFRATEGALERAVDLLRSAVATNPFHEEAHFGLIHYAALMGDRAAALHHYKGYLKLLRDELGAKPSSGVRALADRVARGQTLPPL